jgi:hypothetical protein
VRLRRELLAPIALAVGLGLLYGFVAPHSSDLSAQAARAALFRRSGFVPYWAGWYGGVTTTSYSLVTPFLLGAFGAVWLGALTVMATGVVVVPLLRDTRRPTLGASAFVVAAYLNAVSGRTTFAVGAVVGLATVLAAERGSLPGVAVLGVLTTLISPVAGVLLLVVAAALLVADPPRRRSAIAIGAAVLAAIGAIAVLAHGDTGGYQPFSAPSFAIAMATAGLVALSPVGGRVRSGAVATMLLMVAAFAVHSSVGSNVLRLTTLVAVPAFLAVADLTAVPLTVVAVLLVYSPATQLQFDIARATAADGRPGFTAPVLQQLERQPLVRDHRVELVDTATHWPATYLSASVMLARGWERQVDESRNPLFYGSGPLTAATYRTFLDRNAVAYVLLAQGVPLDFGATREAALIRGDLPYLRALWTNRDWVLYAVTSPTPMVTAPAAVVAHGDTGVTVDTPAPGRYRLRLRWSPYLVVNGGRVLRGPGDDTTLDLASAGTHRVHAVWRLP